MTEKDLYHPIRKKIDFWIWYEENKPKSKYSDEPEKHDAFREKHDLDCVLTKGNLKADTIFSLWLPLRFTLVNINGHALLNSLGGLQNRHHFLKVLASAGYLETLLPENHPAVAALSKLFALGQSRANVMLLPERWLQARGTKPYYDYMPYFLQECFAGGHFSSAFTSDESLVSWLKDEHLSMFFEGGMDKEGIRDLSGSGSIKCGVPKDINILLKNYIDILEKRMIELPHA